jgi:hypothetical protein
VPEPTLEQLQYWMGAVLASRGDLRQKLARAGALHGLEVEQVIATRRGPSAQRRLDVYAAGYVLRLVECLSEDFPLLRTFLGEPLFETFARAYIVEHPPRARSLFELGREFPAFLARTQPSTEALPPEQHAWLALPAELARLERTCSEVGRARGLEANASAVLASPFDVLCGQVHTEAAPCLHLLELGYDLLDFCAVLERGERPSPPGPQHVYVAVSRASYRVTRTRLEPWQHDFLGWCRAASAPVTPLAWSGSPHAREWLAELLVWLPLAAERGLVRLVASAPEL